MNKRIIWQLPTHQSDVTNLDWIHPKAKFHAFDEYYTSLCKRHRQGSFFEQYDFDKALEEYGENAFCKKCLKKYLELMKKKIRVPKVGEKFHFFDDGKSSPSRHYIVTITDVKNFDDLSETLQNEIKEEQKQCYWLYAKETDYVLKGVLNDSEIEPLYFIRTTDGEWFSIGSWGGELDKAHTGHGQYSCYR